MGIMDRLRGRREVREASTVANGGGGALAMLPAHDLAIVQAASGLWERAFAAARTTALTPTMLALVGRTLFRKGDMVLLRRGRAFLPAASYDIRGGVEPSTWTYDLDLPAPGGMGTLKGIASSQVAHVRINADVAEPWRGRGPLTVAKLTTDLAARIEQALEHEERIPVGQVLAIPSTAQADALADQVASLKGDIVLGESTATGWDTGQANRASGRAEWQPTRLGPRPPAEQMTLRTDVAASILAAAGVPAQLILADSEQGMRESWRRFLFSTIAPIGRMLEAELSRVTGRAVGLDFGGLFASDLAGRSRAYKQLLEAGMSDADARRVCGFDA